MIILEILLLLLLFGLTQIIFNILKKKHKFLNKKLLNKLFWYHTFFGVVYYIYVSFNPSDSKGYYWSPLSDGFSWKDSFGTGTTFIEFLTYPFVSYLNFSYEMMMILFGWFGFLGFIYAYLFFRENIPIKIKIFKYFDLLSLILFLPNMHFWTASLGKGSIIFFGLMLFAYAVNKPKERIYKLIFALLIIYFVRPHIFLFIAVGTLLGYMSGKEKIAFWKKLMVYIFLIGGLLIAQNKILSVVGIEDSENVIGDFENFTESRAEGLSESASGVDISSYPLPLKFFTFWFRPLFFDSGGFFSIITSFENLLYLLLFFKILRMSFVKFLFKSEVVVKMSIVVFLLSSFAMTFVMSNLGIIMRQKTMVMYFLFFVIYYYLAQKKYDRFVKLKRMRKLREKRESELVSV